MIRIFLATFVLLVLLATIGIAAEKEFGSIGAQVVPTETGEVVVLQLIENAPAAMAGLLPGDLIVRIDGIELEGLDFRTVTRQHLWGYIGEEVRVSWLRPGEIGMREADLVRVKIDAKQLRHPEVKMLDPKKQ